MIPEIFTEAHRKIHAQKLKTGVASLAWAVAKDGEILYESALGWANRATRMAATPHTLYSLASISKPITATALMILVERGLIDLDQPLNTYLGAAKLTAHIGDASNATVRRVANHSSGLPLHCHFLYEDEGVDIPPMDETIRRYGHLMMPPGETYQYANSGYGFLQYLIERISGKPYVDFLREELFIPLNMPHASVDVPPELAHCAAIRYNPGGQPLPWYTFDHPGASAVWASAHDLVRFGMFHLKAHLPDQRAILTGESIEAMQQPTVRSSAQSGYGIGWRVTEDDGGYLTTGHDGSMGGVRTRLILVPEENIAVAVVVNGQGDLPISVATQLITALLPDYTNNRQKRQSAPQASKIWTPTSDLIGQWEGQLHTYAGDHALTLTCQPDGDVHVQLDNQFKTLLNNPQFDNGKLTGEFRSKINTDDANKHPYHLRLNLKMRDGKLNGPTHVISTPKNRSGNALSYWTELIRKPA